MPSLSSLPPLVTGEVNNPFQRLYLEINFLSDMAKGGAEAILASLIAPLDLICLTPYDWQLCVSKFRDIKEG